jgi:hypothetical protein
MLDCSCSSLPDQRTGHRFAPQAKSARSIRSSPRKRIRSKISHFLHKNSFFTTNHLHSVHNHLHFTTNFTRFSRPTRPFLPNPERKRRHPANLISGRDPGKVCSLFPFPCSLTPVPPPLFPHPCSPLFSDPWNLTPETWHLKPDTWNLTPDPAVKQRILHPPKNEAHPFAGYFARFAIIEVIKPKKRIVRGEIGPRFLTPETLKSAFWSRIRGIP